MLNLSHQVCFFLLIIYQGICSFAVEESPLRMFFRHIDLNANDELDVYELQHFFHDIEPENPVVDPDRLIHTMQRAMKQVPNKQEQPFTISWQQFRHSYAELDTVTEISAPQVRLLHSIFVKYFSFILSNYIYLCLLMVPGRL
jgi:hypothetical protein